MARSTRRRHLATVILGVTKLAPTPGSDPASPDEGYFDDVRFAPAVQRFVRGLVRE